MSAMVGLIRAALVRPIRWYIKRQNERLAKMVSPLLGPTDFLYLDVGAAEGLQPRWRQYESRILVSGIEPHQLSNSAMLEEGFKAGQEVLWSTTKSLTYYSCKKPTVSGVFQPNFSFLEKFPNSDRFKVLAEKRVVTNTLNNVFEGHGHPDFIKLDIQGAELEVLKGGEDLLPTTLGIEVEVEFKELYLGQPLMHNVSDFLVSRGFTFVDFVNVCRWERHAYRGFGEVVFGDALFLLSPETFIGGLGKIDNVEPYPMWRKYAFILGVYCRLDYLEELLKYAPISLKHDIALLAKFLDSRFRGLERLQGWSTLFSQFYLPYSSPTYWY